METSAQKLSKGRKSKLLKHQTRERQCEIYPCGFYWTNKYSECHWGSRFVLSQSYSNTPSEKSVLLTLPITVLLWSESVAHFSWSNLPLYITLGCNNPTASFQDEGKNIRKKNAHTESRSKGSTFQGQNPVWSRSLLAEQVTKSCPLLPLPGSIRSFDANLLGCKPAAQFCKVQEPRWPICSAQPAEGARTLWREGWNSHSGWLPPRSSPPRQLQANSGKMGCLSWTE